MSSSDKVLERIARILKQAENTDNEHERDTAMNAAHMLSSKHSIDLSMARAYAEGEEQSRQNLPSQKSFEMGQKGDRGAGTYSDLLIAIGEAHDMDWWRYGNEEVSLFGLSFDMEYVERLFPILLIQMVEETRTFLDSGEWKQDGVKRTEARYSFCRSFARRVKERIATARYQAKREAEQQYSGSGMELVLSDQRKEVRSLFRGVHPTNKAFRDQRRDMSRTGRSKGREAGERARISADAELAQQGKLSR